MTGPDREIRIDIGRQLLELREAGRLVRRYAVATALNGAGERNGSGCTPRGRHRVRIRVGEGCPPGTVFVGRRPTGEIYGPALAAVEPGRDWILTRILWLTGCEHGRNRGGDIDTLRRYIYIHGCPDDAPVGAPLSHGCIRMHSADILDLFGRVSNGTPVEIVE